jgi:hypothetical protein
MRQGPSKQQPQSAIQAGSPEKRYHWVKPSDLPERSELIDRVTGKRAAVILTIAHQFLWNRSTSSLLHGTRPAEGECESLQEAKNRVTDGLSNEM